MKIYVVRQVSMGGSGGWHTVAYYTTPEEAQKHADSLGRYEIRISEGGKRYGNKRGAIHEVEVMEKFEEMKHDKNPN